MGAVWHRAYVPALRLYGSVRQIGHFMSGDSLTGAAAGRDALLYLGNPAQALAGNRRWSGRCGLVSRAKSQPESMEPPSVNPSMHSRRISQSPCNPSLLA